MITRDERRELIRYIEGRKCEDARRGDPCVDRHRRGDLVDLRHPACQAAERMIEVADRAE